MRRFIKRVVLLVFAIVVSLFIAEGLARLFFDPVDYLWRKVEPDEILRHRVRPHTAAHDAWGYRNKYVPERADIVAIGDSQTYGTSALAKYSWPSTLKTLTGREVYNMSLGGYGPAEYFYLMEHQAFQLKPDLIIAGFYLGNDLADTFTAVYTVPYWKDLRNTELDIDENAAIAAYSAPIKEKPPHRNPLQARFENIAYAGADWLAGHSVMYRVITSSYLGDMLRQNRMIESGEEVVTFRDDEHGIDTGFTPRSRLLALDMNKPDVREGLRLSLQFLNEMNVLAKENGVSFLVVMIPTKESVYADFIEGNGSLEHSEAIDRLIENERRVNRIAKSYFEEHGISYVDVLSPLKSAAGSKRIYPSNYSGHCNENGYRVIAETVQRYLDERRQH